MISKPLHYPDDFKKEVISALPNEPEIKLLLASGSIFAVEDCLKRNNQAALLEKWNAIFKDRPKDSIARASAGIC